jgi:hypothetical protein
VASDPGLFVPSAAVQSNALTGLGICPRHANPAVRSKKRSYYSATPPWVYVLILASLLIAVIIMIAIRKTVTGQVPDCATCMAEQKKRTAIAWVIAAVAVAVLLAGLSATNGLVSLIGFLLLVVAICYPLAAPKKWQQGVVTKDGYWVEMKKVAPAFAAAVQHQVAAATPIPAAPQWGPPTPQA